MRVAYYVFEKFLADFLRIYRTLPVTICHGIQRLFAYIVFLACLEVVTIFSISFLAISVAAPEKLREFAMMEWLFRFFPQVDALCAEPRVFALLVSLMVVALTAAKNAMTAFVLLKISYLGEEIALFAGEIVFRHYLYSPYIVHLGGDSQRMFQALSWRSQLGIVVIGLMTVYSYAAVSLALLITLLFATPQAILLIILLVVTISFSVYKSLKGAIDRAGTATAEFNRKQNQTTLNAMRGIREALIYRQQPVFFETFRKACHDGLLDRAFLTMAPPVPACILETLGFMVIPVTLWAMYALQDASMARITGVLTMIMLVSWRVLPLLNRSLSTLVSVRGIRHAALDCLAKVEEALANPAPEPPAPDPDFTMREGIAFADVSFRYPNAKVDCLCNLSFAVRRGARMGIVGQSGAGKSSIAGIFSGLVAPSSGALLVDGRPLNPAGIAAYTRQVGYVPQTPYIMAGTLAENIAFSQWGKPCDDERVKAVCRMAELDIAEKRGIDMRTGENGAGLSGGQTQRLSIARALYANPAILIMDEATSSLDSGVEVNIMNTIFSLPQSITTVIIAHRLTTVEHCDTILWINEGRLVAQGTPQEILPRYSRFLMEVGKNPES
jgi:ABC-type multidrug transport system fused ATPase/permease subunit